MDHSPLILIEMPHFGVCSLLRAALSIVNANVHRRGLYSAKRLSNAILILAAYAVREHEKSRISGILSRLSG